jgi:DHA1 family bicyclomycin/chloramphenicol resistance-like MFS transporter
MQSRTEARADTIPKKARTAAGTGYAVLAIVLAGLAMLGPFSVDTYLPAFPNMQAELFATPLEVQQTLSAYMFSFAIMMLFYGVLSDAFGRRNIILVSLAVYGLASLGCAATHSIEYLWAFRIVQGMSAGAGVVIGRAIIRDMYAGAPAERLLSLVTMIFSIAPAIAPIIGGWIVTLLDWRSIFLFLVIYTVLLLWLCWKHLPETLPPEKRQPFNPAFLFKSYKGIFTSPLFYCLAGVLASNFSGMFLYVAAAPVFLTQHLGLTAAQFGYQFVPNVSGNFIGSFAANRMAGKVEIPKQITIGFCFIVGAPAFGVLYHCFFPPVLFWSILPLFFYTIGMGIVMPGALLMTLDLFPHIRGTVASCQSFMLTLSAAITAGMISPFLSNSALWLASGQLTIALIGLSLWLAASAWQNRPDRHVAPVS